eukprot:15204410-Heterocapsa_arctica.AAC.1
MLKLFLGSGKNPRNFTGGPSFFGKSCIKPRDITGDPSFILSFLVSVPCTMVKNPKVFTDYMSFLSVSLSGHWCQVNPMP